MLSVWVKSFRRIGEGDQADLFSMIQNRPNISVHLKVDEDQ